MGPSRLLWLPFVTAAAVAPPDDLVVVGAGAGGAYAAWRAATSGRSVTVYEMAGRPGGRIHSLRGQGPQRDLVVEAGAYRFAPTPVVDKVGNFTWRIHTPLTAAIIEELGLPSGMYNPDPSMWDHGLRKIVDEHGKAAGFLTFVEHMLALAQRAGARVRYGQQVVAIRAGASGEPVALRLAGGGEALGRAVLLNLPQAPLLELLRRSQGPQLAAAFPRPLYSSIGYPLLKLYVHYEDAWWRNDLGLLAGAFANQDDPSQVTNGWVAVPAQSPAPLQGQYHDGDVRCDGPGGRCRGFLQVFYGGDEGGAIRGAVKYYATFADSVSQDSVVQLSPDLPHQRELLQLIHDALVSFHRPALDAVNATERVARLLPSGGVMSIWSQGVSGIHAGCHFPKPGQNPAPDDVPAAALEPFPGLPLYVANEAFGALRCFAEGSLAMAEDVMERLNVTRPSWLPQTGELGAAPQPGESLVPTDPFLLRSALWALAPVGAAPNRPPAAFAV